MRVLHHFRTFTENNKDYFWAPKARDWNFLFALVMLGVLKSELCQVIEMLYLYSRNVEVQHLMPSRTAINQSVYYLATTHLFKRETFIKTK